MVHIGNDAIYYYWEFRHQIAALELAQQILTESYRIHIGSEGEDFIHRCFLDLYPVLDSGARSDLPPLFSRARAQFAQMNKDGWYRQYKSASLARTLHLIDAASFTGTVVDYGAGDNRLGELLISANPNVDQLTGIDVLPCETSTHTNRLKFLTTDSALIPFESESVDHVIMRFSLHHMPHLEQEKVLRESERILKPNGTLIIIEDGVSLDRTPLCGARYYDNFRDKSNDFCQAALGFLDASSCFTTHETMPFHFSFRTAEEWQAAITNARLQTITVTNWGIPFFSLFQAPLIVIRAQK